MTKVCVYKNCDNYINLKDKTFNDVKLFNFPKNPERRQKWIELGKVNRNIPESMYFFCSDHFDTKYMSVTNRRTSLVGEAVPFPCVETELVDSSEDDKLKYYFCEMKKENASAEPQELLVESTTISNELTDIFHYEHLSDNSDEDESNEKIYQNYSINCTSKRKLETIMEQPVSSKSKILKASPMHKPLRNYVEKTYTRVSHQISPIKNISNLNSIDGISVFSKDTNKKISEKDKVIDESHVTTFIYKGEEYVQMPKEYYINEKIELMQKVLKTEQSIKAIKEIVNS